MIPETEKKRSQSADSRLWRLVLRALWFALLWLVLTGGDGWWFFALLLPLLLWLTERWPAPLLRLRWRNLPGFAGYFLLQMWRGGFDVAWRALPLVPAISPNWQRYPIRLQQPSSQRLLACLISLLPGTTACRSCLSDDVAEQAADQQDVPWLELHLLTDSRHWQQGVAELELRLSVLLAEETPLC